ncbi:hypothetical protein ON010_g12941 [Phytophthora cinnamomi]|nr:hypothetical protein ON010_g12941 [Phytophthora cinnamomi]
MGAAPKKSLIPCSNAFATSEMFSAGEIGENANTALVMQLGRCPVSSSAAAAAPSNSTPGAAVASSSFPMAAEPIRGVRAAARTSTITPGATPSPRTHAAATASSRPPAAAKYELSQRVSKEANPSAPEPGNSTAVAGAGACEGLVVALQNRKTGLAENAIVVGIEPIGILHTAVLKIMKRWHAALKAPATITDTPNWLRTINTTMQASPDFRSPRSTVIKTRLQNLQLFAAEERHILLFPTLEHLDLAGKRAVGDATMNFLLTKLFGGREGVAFIEPGNISIVESGIPRIGTAALSKLVGDLGKEFILLPINCDGVQWCSIMIDIANAQVRVYDPMYSTYSDSVKELAKTIVSSLPPPTKSRCHITPYVAELGHQVDSFNCGIFVLIACELFCGAKFLRRRR